MTMATLKLENLPPELLSQIELLAQQNHCTVDQQAISLLENALKTNSSQTRIEKNKSVTDILEESRCQREKLSTDTQWLDSTLLLRQDRDR